MFESFIVSTDDVGALVNTLGQISHEFDQFSTLGNGFQYGLSGDKIVDESIRNYFSSQSDGMNKIHGRVDEIQKALDGARAAYVSTEQGIANAAAGKSG